MSKMSAEDKRIAFMVISVLLTFVFFFATLASLEDKSWSPLIVTAQLVGAIIGTFAFFYVVFRSLWAAATRIFPDK